MPNIFPEPPIIEIGKTGFDGCDTNGRPFDVLGRKSMGQRLTDLVDRIDQPIVLALDGEWGSGKSHFLKLWTGAHRFELGGKAEVIYFDAFEHDYLDDPLVSLISRLILDQAGRSWTSTAVDKVKKAAYPIAKLIARVGVGLASAGASEVVSTFGDIAVSKIGEAADSAIDEFWKAESGRTAAMKQFREALQSLTQPPEAGDLARKIVFIVDELDRCRPDYALSVLEVIKHFFAVPNVHFVLGTNLSALAHSVKARYGSEIDSEKYIQKFISLTMRFPRDTRYDGNGSAAYAYFAEIADEYSISTQVWQEARDHLKHLAAAQHVQLRDVERILTYLSLFPRHLAEVPYGYLHLLVGATFLRVLFPQTYARLREERLGIKEIESKLSITKPSSLDQNGFPAQHWIIWAQVFASRGSLAVDDTSVTMLERSRGAFGPFGDAFEWTHTHKLFAQAFDSFSLATT